MENKAVLRRGQAHDRYHVFLIVIHQFLQFLGKRLSDG